MNVVNVNKIMHEEAKKLKCNVSAEAVREYSIRIMDHLIDNTYQLFLIAKQNGRKTIMEEDVILLFGKIDNDIA